MYKDIKLEKGLYGVTGKSFTQALTALDPDEQYEDTALKNLDAFERQLKRFDIKVSGKDCDRVEKFFISTESAVLFPEYVRRMIKQGMDEVCITDQICGAISYTDSADFRGLTVTLPKVSGTVVSAKVNEAENIPVTTVRLSDTKTLTKFARKLSCSYESIKKQRLEALGIILKSLGISISREVNKLCLDTITSGVTATTFTAGSLNFADVAGFWGTMSDFDMTTMICDPATMAKILALDEMKLCASEFMASGVAKTPYGITLVKCSQLGENTCVGVDRNSAAEMIFGTDVIVDFDKLISTQCDEIACSVTVGFSVINSGAVKVLKAAQS